MIPAADRVSVHDPSVIYDTKTKKYYVYGSHRAWAKSSDLVKWTTFTNNLSRDYKKILGKIWDAWPSMPTNNDVTGNMWAPDVIYNPTMKKWCMYLSVNGNKEKSVIVLLTADTPDGDWTYVGPVVYSGFDSSNSSTTDVDKVLGHHADLTRYQSTTDTRINAIDPCVKFDEKGDLWMSFGSWFGGIYLLRLNNRTGLRDYSTKYSTKPNKSDAYYGYKIAGGFGNSGEGSYLLHTGKWWYLFLSYGHLEQRGGYQIREFRSSKITGPYVDQDGNPSLSDSAMPNNWEDTTGIRLLSSYQWAGSDPKHFEVSQGHNSAINVNGKSYLVYHTRFADTGEMHQIRVRQLFQTRSGWLTAAPYEYEGTAGEETGYSNADYPGIYQLITHQQMGYFKGLKKDSGKYVGVNQPTSITLNKNGSITGDSKGTWKRENGTNSVTLTLDGTTYSGQFALLPTETKGQKTMTFSAIGGDISIWGAKKPQSSAASAKWCQKLTSEKTVTLWSQPQAQQPIPALVLLARFPRYSERIFTIRRL